MSDFQSFCDAVLEDEDLQEQVIPTANPLLNDPRRQDLCDRRSRLAFQRLHGLIYA